ncbi:MAG TPA: hypothetical protein VLE91_00655 [Candidatus Saccharimonadales bacterium]|nr:hypothetical protein [Candidatus Saccharimonadales bacterium]
MDQNLKDAVLNNITKAENIAIVVAKQTGADGLAAGLALYLSLVKLDKNISIIAQSPTVEDAQNLYGVDKIGQGQGAKTPVVVVDNAIETVDKVTYFLDKTQLKVVIHPLPGTPQISKDQISVEYTAAPANLIFAIGVESLPDLRTSFTHEQEINPEAQIININNLQPSQKFAQIDVVNPQASALSEVVAKFIQDSALPVDEDIAFNLYVGIQHATNNFAPALSSPSSFEVASWLLKFGAGKASFARQSTPHQPFSEPQRAQVPPKPTVTPWQIVSQPPFTQGASPTPIQSNDPFVLNDYDQGDDMYERNQTMEEVERQETPTATLKSSDWLKPPKVYKGSESPGENKG